MESLKIEATKCTPEVTFNAENNILDIKGDSYPENIAEFFLLCIYLARRIFGTTKKSSFYHQYRTELF